MSIEDIVSKLGDVLSKEELEELKGIKNQAPVNSDDIEALTRKQKESDAKAARILEEKKRIKAQNDELLSKIEKLESSGLSDVEKLQKELEKAQKAKEKFEIELKTMQENHTATLRTQKLSEIQGKVKFIDIVPGDMRKMSLEAAFKGVENLDDENAVNETLQAYVKNNKSIIAAESGQSTGMINSVSAPGKPSKSPGEMDVNERATQLLSRDRGNPALRRL